MLSALRASGACRLLACDAVSTQQERSLGRRVPKQGKPPILPPSKKVLYHVVHVPWQKPEDVKELLWRRQIYNCAVTSLREVFREEMNQKANAGVGIEAMKEAESSEFDALLAANEKRNKEKAEMRAQHEEDELKQAKLAILDELETALKEQQARAAEAEKDVRAAIERSKNFVTRENLEAKILAALENPVVYDFAIDVHGNKYYDPKPVKYQEGTPTRQKGRLYDKTLGGPTEARYAPPPPETPNEPEGERVNA